VQEEAKLLLLESTLEAAVKRELNAYQVFHTSCQFRLQTVDLRFEGVALLVRHASFSAQHQHLPLLRFAGTSPDQVSRRRLPFVSYIETLYASLAQEAERLGDD